MGVEFQFLEQLQQPFIKAMPFVSKIIHVRWSGEGVWSPLGGLDFGVGYENNTCYPSPGQIILYPGGVSETEVKELAVMPVKRPSAPRAVMIVTPVAKSPRAWRSLSVAGV